MVARYLNLYAEFIKKFLNLGKPLKVVFDCSNGSAGLVIKRLKVPNSKFSLLNSRPNGRFPAHGPDPTESGATRQLQRTVLKEKADLGVIFDDDGDRAYFVDNRGRLIPSYLVAYLLFLETKPPYIADNPTFHYLKMASLLRGKTFISPVGSYFVKKLMRQKSANRGAEYSGHYYFKEFFYADSGILTAIKIINAFSRMPYSSSDFVNLQAKKIYTALFNIKSQRPHIVLSKIKKIFRKRAKRIKILDGLTFEFKDWFLIARPSNTEPLVRVFIGAENNAFILRASKAIKRLY